VKSRLFFTFSVLFCLAGCGSDSSDDNEPGSSPFNVNNGPGVAADPENAQAPAADNNAGMPPVNDDGANDDPSAETPAPEALPEDDSVLQAPTMDPEPEVGPQPGMDVEPEADPETEPNAGTDPNPDAEPEVEPEAELEPEFEFRYFDIFNHFGAQAALVLRDINRSVQSGFFTQSGIDCILDARTRRTQFTAMCDPGYPVSGGELTLAIARENPECEQALVGGDYDAIVFDCTYTEVALTVDSINATLTWSQDAELEDPNIVLVIEGQDSCNISNEGQSSCTDRQLQAISEAVASAPPAVEPNLLDEVQINGEKYFAITDYLFNAAAQLYLDLEDRRQDETVGPEELACADIANNDVPLELRCDPAYPTAGGEISVAVAVPAFEAAGECFIDRAPNENCEYAEIVVKIDVDAVGVTARYSVSVPGGDPSLRLSGGLNSLNCFQGPEVTDCPDGPIRELVAFIRN